MGMKEITLPKELLNLPQPWGETDFLRRHKQIDILSYQKNEIRTALNVLERCLHSLSLLTPPKAFSDSIPESLIESWVFIARWLADEMPTLDELRLYKVESKLKEYGIESPSPTLTNQLAKQWLWSVVSGIERAALNWLENALMETREPILISRFLYMAERYWEKIDPGFAESLLSASAMIAWEKVLPLFESVEQNPNASETVIETVQDYRDWILDNPPKWPPGSDAFYEYELRIHESCSGDGRSHDLSQTMAEPALAELAYV